MFDLSEKTAVITGGGSGIGKAIALLFARQGSAVHILDLDGAAAAAVAAEITEFGQKAAAHQADVTDRKQIQEIFQHVGHPDILINNAGIAHIGTVETTSEEEFEKLFNVNVKGAFNCIAAAIPWMKANRYGVILSMASIAALVGIEDRFAYSMTKGAVYAMSMSIARDYLSYNIRSNSLSPARVHTPFVDGFINRNYPGRETEILDKLSKAQPVGRMARPEEVACLALYLCSDESGFITGCDYPIDGGFLKLNN